MSMDTIIILIIIGFVLLFGAVLVYSIRSNAKARARKEEAAQAAGFTPLPSPPPEICARIIELHEKPGRTRFKLQNLSTKSFPDGEMYLFDLEETSGEDNTQLAAQDVLIVSQYLQMPRFSLVPRLEAGGKLGEVANRVLEWAATRQGKRIELTGHAEFDRRYWVTGPDREAIDRFLTPNRLEGFASTQYYDLEAGGDAFAFSHTKFPNARWEHATASVSDINEKIRRGMQLFSWLGSSEERSENRTMPSILSGEWKNLSQGEWVKPRPATRRSRFAEVAQNTGCMLPFGLVWTAFSALFLVLGIVTYSNDLRTYNLLNREGVRSFAVVTERYASTDSEGDDTYYVRYEYSVPISGDETRLSTTESVPEAIYKGLEKGMAVEIRYVENQPEISRIEADFGPPGLMLPVCFGGMGFVFTLIGLGLIAGALRSTWQALLKKDEAKRAADL
jgi:hypothetical protein